MGLFFLSFPLIEAILIVSLAVLYGLVTAAVFRRWFIAGWDIPFTSWVVAQNTPLGYRVFVAITNLGSYKVIRAGAALIGLGLIAAGDWRRLAMLLGVVGLAMVVTHFLKPMLPRTRPAFPQDPLLKTSPSYPSGHTMLSTAFYIMVAYLGWVYLPAPVGRWPVVLVAAALVLLIGFSRVYLGVHYLTDVIGGWLAGGLVFLLVLLLSNLILFPPVA